MKKLLALSAWGILAALTALPAFAQNAGKQPPAAGKEGIFSSIPAGGIVTSATVCS